MDDSPRPQDVGDQRTPVGPEPEYDEAGSATDPRDQPGIRGTVANLPYWVIVLAVILVALVALYLAWLVLPPR